MHGPPPHILPPLQGEGRGGDGVKGADTPCPHPPPGLPLKGPMKGEEPYAAGTGSPTYAVTRHPLLVTVSRHSPLLTTASPGKYCCSRPSTLAASARSAWLCAAVHVKRAPRRGQRAPM